MITAFQQTQQVVLTVLNLNLSRAIASTVPTYRALSDLAAARKDFARAAMISSLGQQIDGTPASSFFHAKRLIQGGDSVGK